MNFLTAAILALVLGLAVAWFTYFYKKRSTSDWVLAFFRFSWIGMLLFAFFAPEREEQTIVEQPQLISLRIDSSASLKSPLNGVLDLLIDFEKKAPVKWVLSDFNSSQDPNDELPWIYVGDGHIDVPKGTAPIASVLLEANSLLSPPLIKNVIVPERVEIGAKFDYRVRFTTEPETVRATFNGKSQNRSAATFIAPDLPGRYLLTLTAERNGIEDVIERTIEVVPYFNTIQVISPYPHPHIGMVNRLAQELGFTYHLLSWKEAKTQLKQFPTVAIGGGLPVFEQLDAQLDKPILWLDSSNDPPQGTADRIRSPEALVSIGAPEYFSIRKRDKKKDKLQRIGQNWNGRGINWFQDGLAYPETGSVFRALIKGLLRDSRPDELRVSGPERLYQSQEAEWVVGVVNNRSLAQAAAVEMKITRDDEIFDIPQAEAIEGNGYFFSTSFSEAGTYALEIKAEASNEQYSWQSTVSVLPASIEQYRPFNKAMWDRYSKNELFRATDVNTLQIAIANWELEGRSMVRTKKTPQHNLWWYWGAFLIFAFAEWLLRRRKGLS
ncbi:hypothetical protein OAP05_02540 [Schleiferiaceae bacterium]|nr:hypothetical protein [Schleiferiaceae bacterium]